MTSTNKSDEGGEWIHARVVDGETVQAWSPDKDGEVEYALDTPVGHKKKRIIAKYDDGEWVHEYHDVEADETIRKVVTKDDPNAFVIEGDEASPRVEFVFFWHDGGDKEGGDDEN